MLQFLLLFIFRVRIVRALRDFFAYIVKVRYQPLEHFLTVRKNDCSL